MGESSSTATALRGMSADMVAAAKDAGVLDDTGGLDTDDAAGPEAAGLEKPAMAAALDAGAVPDLVIPDRRLKHALEEFERREGTPRDAIKLIREASAIEKVHGHALGHARGFKRGMEHMRRRGVGGTIELSAGMRHEHDLLPVVPWSRSGALDRHRWDIIRRYKDIHNGNVQAGVGYYWGTLQVPMTVEQGTAGTSQQFVLNVPPASGQTANPIIDSCFDLAIGNVEENWFGGPHTLDLSDTNLQNPGAFLYPDQLFMIEAVSARLKSIRIQYYAVGSAPGAVSPNIFSFNPALSPVTAGTLQGSNPVWDRGALVLPVEFFNSLTDVSELAQAVAMATTICFAWSDLGTGGVINNSNIPIERMCAVPGHARTGVQETSGAGLHLHLERAYIWCLDKQFQASTDEGGNGLFSAQLQQAQSFSFPFTPVANLFNVATPVPLGVAIEWQLSLHGTSLQPGVRDPSVRPIQRRM